MKERKSDSSIWHEVLSYEERLRKGAARARMETRDRDLASLFSGVNRRRRTRTDVTQVFPDGWYKAREAQIPSSRAGWSALSPAASGAPSVSTDVRVAGAPGGAAALDTSVTAVRSSAGEASSVTAVGAQASLLTSAAPAGTPTAAAVRSAAAESSAKSAAPGARAGLGNSAQGAGRTAPPSTSGVPGTVLSVTRIAGSVAMLQVAKPPALRFRAGQHMKVNLPGRGKNPYSIASAPSDSHLELCVERIPGGRLSGQLYALEPGMHLELDAQPKGSFVLQPKAAIHLMLATVTGIAPFRSMLREAAAQNSWPYFVVLHGASFADELPYREELEALAQRHPQQLRYLPSVSRPGDLRNRNFKGLTGRLTELAPGLVRELQASRPGQTIQVYACGHPDMVSTVNTTLGSMGFSVASEVFD